MGFDGFSKIVFLVCEHFLPPLLIALLVVFMEVFAPHKMVHGNEWVPDPRIADWASVPAPRRPTCPLVSGPYLCP